MSLKPIVPRERANRDIENAIAYYAREAGASIAMDFIDEVQDAYVAIANYPQAGSQRYAHELDLPGLCNRLLKRFPYMVFYVEREDHIDVWRVLHAQRDIPAGLQLTNS